MTQITLTTPNTIKVFSTEILCDILCNHTFLLNLSEETIFEKCTSMEKQHDFKNMFFFIDESLELYFYQQQNEQEIKNYILKEFNIPELDERTFEKYSNYLYNCHGNSPIRIGDITIDSIEFYEELENSFMTGDTIISKLVFAGRKNRFYWEMDNVKKLCLMITLKKKYEEALLEINSYEFDE